MRNFARLAVFLLIIAGIIGYLKTGADLFEQVKGSGLKLQLNQIDQALVQAKRQSRRYPRDIHAFLREQFGQDGARDPSKDPWGTHYVFSSKGRGFDLSSAGADRQFGTEDDVIWRRRGDERGLVQEKVKLSSRQRRVPEQAQEEPLDPLFAQLISLGQDRVKAVDSYSEEELNQVLVDVLKYSGMELSDFE